MSNPILELEYKENCYVFLSYHWQKEDFAGNGTSDGQVIKRIVTSFVYYNEYIAVEWEPRYGPIKIFYGVPEDHPDAKSHYIFPFIDGSRGMAWSQLAVERAGLPYALYRGSIDYIFEVLREWATR